MAEPLKLFSQVVNSNLGCQESSGSIAAWECDLLQGDFLTGPPLNLLSVGWNVTDFKKNVKSPRLAPPNDRKKVLSVY